MAEIAERSARLAMEPRSVRIEEHRIADLHFDGAVAHRIVGTHTLPEAGRPPRDPADPDPVPEHRREGGRGHVALVILDFRRSRQGQEMRTRAWPRLAIDR